jgi:restriction system protein
MIAALASVGQYVVPLICLGGAAMSGWKRRQREALVSNVAQAKGADSLGMSWREFEVPVGEAYRLQGYNVVEAGGGGPDGGVDLVLTKGNEKFLVQCKQWKAFKVGVDVLRELYGVIAAKGATGGFVVTSGRFTEDATSFADGRNVNLVDGHRLFDLIKQAQQSISRHAGDAEHQRPVAAPVASPLAPTCSLCASEKIKRTARKDSTAGSQFWGCSKFSSGCRGARAISGRGRRCKYASGTNLADKVIDACSLLGLEVIRK